MTLLLADAAQGSGAQGPPEYATWGSLVVAILTIVANVVIAVLRNRTKRPTSPPAKEAAPAPAPGRSDAPPSRFDVAGDVSFAEAVRRLQAVEAKAAELECQLEEHVKEQHKADLELAKTLKVIETETGRLIKITEARDGERRSIP